MQKRITPKKNRLILSRAFLPLIALCISAHASLAQKPPAARTKNASDEQRKKADAAANAGTSAAFSDAVKNTASGPAKNIPAVKPVTDKKNAAAKRTEVQVADITAKPKNN